MQTAVYCGVPARQLARSRWRSAVITEETQLPGASG